MRSWLSPHGLAPRGLELVMVIMVGLCVTACQTTQLPSNTTLSFRDKAPIRLNVATVQVLEEYQPRNTPPAIDTQLNPTPSEAIKQWANERLSTRPGAPNRAEVIIKNAQVTETALPRTEGFKGAFTRDQAARFDINLAVEIRLYADDAIVSVAEVSAQSTRSNTLVEGASLATRDVVLQQLLRDAMQSLDAELDKNIRLYFSRFIAP